jgi:DnaD/phage-associated family protein
MKTDEIKGVYATETEDSLNNARAMIGWDKPIEIVDDGDLRKYRIELPNLYDDSGLDPFEFRLLGHYKRVGVCTESTRTTADACKMSPAQVSIKRKCLHTKGFIFMQKVPISEKEFSYKISIIDRWEENFIKYAKRLPDKQKRLPHETKNTTKGEVQKNIFTHYEANIGILTPMIADSLEDAEKLYPFEWILDSFRLAVENNKRNWRYCEAILKRWKESGKDDGKGKPKQTDETRPEYQPFPFAGDA